MILKINKGNLVVNVNFWAHLKNGLVTFYTQ